MNRAGVRGNHLLARLRAATLSLRPNVSAIVATAESHSMAHDAIHGSGVSGHGDQYAPGH